MEGQLIMENYSLSCVLFVLVYAVKQLRCISPPRIRGSTQIQTQAVGLDQRFKKDTVGILMTAVREYTKFKSATENLILVCGSKMTIFWLFFTLLILELQNLLCFQSVFNPSNKKVIQMETIPEDVCFSGAI